MRELPVLSNWQCMGDAHCCQGPVRMTEAEWAVLAEQKVPGVLAERMDDGWRLLKGTPCPMLDENKRCRVYDVRPFRCRTFMCLRVKGEEFVPSDEEHLGCANLYVRIVSSRMARNQYRRNQKKAQLWGLDHGWTETMT